MEKKDAVRRILKESFGYSDARMNKVFDPIYDDSDAMLLEKGGQPVSTLMMRHNDFLFHDQIVGMSCISQCATRRTSRGNGFMSELVAESLLESRRRGDMLTALVPTRDWLYFFFDRLGFSTVFYNDRQRFTSLHTFGAGEGYQPVENPLSDEVFEAFHRMEMHRGCTVLHSAADFRLSVENAADEPGKAFVAVADGSRRVAAMAWASLSADRELLTVTDLLGIDRSAMRGAMHELRRRFPDVAVQIMAVPGDTHRRLYACGMARIVDVAQCLEKVAAANPDLCLTMRVTDRIIPDNSHYYTIENGSLYLVDERSDRPDFDITAEVLCRIVFSSPAIGSIIGFPSVRPSLFM